MNSSPSLASPDLVPVFEAIRTRMERFGAEKRGRMRLPADVTTRGRFLLSALVDIPVRSTVDLAALEGKLSELGVGGDLAVALGALGYPLSAEQEQRRMARRQGRDARRAARQEVETWGEEWAREWVDVVVRAGVLSGLDSDESVRLVRATREILARIEAAADASDRQSRVDLAATVLGDSHALDWGTRQSAAVTRALSNRYGGEGRVEPWERAGVNLDRVSAPVLTWGFVPPRGGPMAALLARATGLGVPLHLSQLALRQYPVVVEQGCDILVTENPRMVEAACERRTSHPVVALNGNPSAAARLLLEQLLHSGASLRYHGDFDAAGLRICARMYGLGLVPWHMDRSSYLDAIEEADAQRAELPVDTYRSPPTPWDPPLQQAFEQHRRVVHEERLILSLLG